MFQDAQNRVAAFALYSLFPDLPIHLVLVEPYASMVVQWKTGNLVRIYVMCLEQNSKRKEWTGIYEALM